MGPERAEGRPKKWDVGRTREQGGGVSRAGWILCARRRTNTRRGRPLLVETLENRSLLAQVTLSPVADNTLYENPNGNLSNGAGQYLFAGQAAAGAGVRRTLLKFDVAGSVPAGSQIDSVTLQLNVTKVRPGAGPAAFGIHRVLADWGEGDSIASGNQGQGATAQTDDATWVHRFFPQTVWNQQGGDFVTAASASTVVGDLASYTWSSAQMAADVQGWLNAPATQFGWLLKQVDENVEGAARRFDSREALSPQDRPRLIINYSVGNSAPTLSVINDPPPILEDAPLQTINLVGISAGPGENQRLRVTALSSDPIVIPTPTVNYTSPNATGSLSYAPAANRSGTAVITVTVRDAGPDDTFDSADDATFSRTFSVAVRPVNDAPTLSAIPNPPAIPQDAAQQTIPLSGISAGPLENQTLTITAQSSNTDLIPHPAVNYTSPGSTGSLTYRPNTGQSGTATITVTVKDSGGTADGGVDTVQRTFTVVVNPPGFVNQPPTFVKGNDQTANDNDGAVIVAGWATSISPGPPAEASQSVQFLLSAANPGLFAAQPSVDAAGTLRFTPAPNASGTTTVSVQLKDNGGTANGGVDVSAVATFQITIHKPLPWHNTLHALDVTNSQANGTDGQVVAGDALAIINYINSTGAGRVPVGAAIGPPFLDTVDPQGDYRGDNFVVPGDALAVINFINASGPGLPGPAGEGEEGPDSFLGAAGDLLASQPTDAARSLAILLATLEAPAAVRRRR